MSSVVKKVTITSWSCYPSSSMFLEEIELSTRILMPQIKSIKKLCVPHKEKKGDGAGPRLLPANCTVISALIVGLDVLMKYCRHLKYIKNIIVLTDGRGETDWSQTEDVAQQINKQGIHLSVLYFSHARQKT